MYCVIKELIDKELEGDRKAGYTYRYRKLSKKFMDWLFEHYKLQELCENFYDSEPEFDEEEFNMYMDYEEKIKMTGMTFWNIVSNMEEMKKQGGSFMYSKKEHTKEEFKQAYDKVRKMYKDYEQTRLKFNNWQEPHFEGNWGATQKSVDTFGKNVMERDICGFPRSIKDRLYVASKDNQIRIYFYGRDALKVDYWFIFVRKPVGKKKKKKKHLQMPA